MTQRSASSGAKQIRSIMRIWLAIFTALVAAFPATAAAHTAPSNASSPNGNDPFAVYEANLSDAASGALHRVAQLQPAIATWQAFQKAGTVATPTTAPLRDMPNRWKRTEQLRPILEPILSQVGVPVELAAIVVVESGGDPTIPSPKGALGLWQLMPDTARRYGLIVNADTDERLDILKSTRAAAEYLRDLYAEFHDWQLVLAAYNAGEHAVEQALARTKGTVFSAAAQALPAETQSYVPAVLNALARFGNRTPQGLTGNPRLQPAVYAVMDR